MPFYNQSFSSSLPQATVDLIYLRFIVSFVCCSCSVAQSCPTLCNPINCSMPGSLSFTISRSLLRFMSTDRWWCLTISSCAAPFFFCLQSFPVKSESCSVMSNSLQPHVLYSSWNFPGQNTGVGSLSFLPNHPGLPHCRQIYQLSHKGNPRTLEWVAYSFSSGSSLPRNWTRSPAMQVDSLLTDLLGKPFVSWENIKAIPPPVSG